MSFIWSLDETTVALNFSGPHAANGALGLAGADEDLLLALTTLFTAFKADIQGLHIFFESSVPVRTSQPTDRYIRYTSK